MPTATDPTLVEVVETRAQECLELGEKLGELRTRLRKDPTDDNAKAVRTATTEVLTADALFTIAQKQWDYELRKLQWDHAVAEAAKPAESRGPGAAGVNLHRETRTLGEQFVESDGYKNRPSGDWKATWNIEGRSLLGTDLETRTLLSSETSDPAAGLFRPVGTPFLQAPRQRRVFVRDVIPVTPTSLASVPYIRELNPATTEVGASSVGEGMLKPEVTMQFVQANAPAEVIAAWIPITRQVAEDAPTLRGYVDGRLMYMLAVREEQQILNGSGTSPQLRGIRQTTGIQTQSFATDDITTIGRGISKVELVDGYPDAVAINPADFWTMVTTRRATQFDSGFSTGLPYGTAPSSLWGLTPIRTRAVEAGVAIVGDWGMGAQIFDRMQAQIRTTDSHSDYFVYNKEVVLAEERVALAVHRPDFFVECDLTA